MVRLCLCVGLALCIGLCSAVVWADAPAEKCAEKKPAAEAKKPCCPKAAAQKPAAKPAPKRPAARPAPKKPEAKKPEPRRLPPKPLPERPEECRQALDRGLLSRHACLACRRCGLRPAFCEAVALLGNLRVRQAWDFAFVELRLSRTKQAARRRPEVAAARGVTASGG